jgi:hypothetical protein
MRTHSGGCHCGRVRFEVIAPAQLEVADCNCSMCSKCGYLHLIVPAAFDLFIQHAYREAFLLLYVRREILLCSAVAS